MEVDGFKISRGEVKHFQGERTNPMSERGPFQTQHSPGAQLTWYLFVALFWSLAGPRWTKPGDILQVRPDWVQSNQVICRKKNPFTHASQKEPPRSNSSNTTTKWLNSSEVACDHVKKCWTYSQQSHRHVKTNLSGLATSAHLSSDGGAKSERQSPTEAAE